jgi:hypothetical protein
MAKHLVGCGNVDLALFKQKEECDVILLRKVQPTKVDTDAIVDDEIEGADPKDRRNAIEEDMSVLKIMNQ